MAQNLKINIFWRKNVNHTVSFDGDSVVVLTFEEGFESDDKFTFTGLKLFGKGAITNYNSDNNLNFALQTTDPESRFQDTRPLHLAQVEMTSQETQIILRKILFVY